MLAGIGGVLAGAIHAFGILASGFTAIRLADAVLNTVLGILTLVCSRLLAKRNSLVIWLAGGTVLFSIAYSFAVGRGFNFVMAAIGALLIWQLVSLKRHGELASSCRQTSDHHLVSTAGHGSGWRAAWATIVTS